MKKISIVIPVYNEDAIVEHEVRALIGKLQASFAPDTYELLLVENGSYDRTRSIVIALEKEFSNIRGVYLSEAGYGQALKEGLLKSTGTYVAIFNIDLWDVAFLQNSVRLLDDPSLDMVIGSKT